MPLLAGRALTGAVAAATLGVDQITKAIVVRTLRPGESATVIPGFLDLTLVTNPGGVFGLLRDLDGPLRGLLFSAVPVAAILLMLVYGWRLPPERVWSRTALGLILGGALGNLADRLRLGHVVDFVDAYVGPWHWWTFNAADSGICVGVAMILVEGFLLRGADGRSASTTPSASPP